MENQPTTNYVLHCKSTNDATQAEILLKFLFHLDARAFYALIYKYAEVS